MNVNQIPEPQVPVDILSACLPLADLPNDLDSRDPKEQADIILRTHISNAQKYVECSSKQRQAELYHIAIKEYLNEIRR